MFRVIRLRKILLFFALIISFSVGVFVATNNERYASLNGDYSKTLVIDAGHGGFDGGAVGANGTSEQYITLSIAKKTESLAGFFGLKTAMTRTDEMALDYVEGRKIRENKVADIKKREQITNATENPVFLSIHLNKFEDGKYKGAQVFYSKNNPDSNVLATHLQKYMIEGLDKTNNRKEKPALESVYLTKKLKCPAVIVECGFLSNPQEELLLKEDSYHKKISICIIKGYLEYLKEGNL